MTLYHTFDTRFIIELRAIIFANSCREKCNNDNNHKLRDFLIDPFLYHSTDYIIKGKEIKKLWADDV